MMYLGILGIIIGFIIFYKCKKYEMKNMTDAGVVKQKSVMSGFGWYMFKVLGGILILGGLLTSFISFLMDK